MLSGVAAVLAVIGFGSTALPSLSVGGLDRRDTFPASDRVAPIAPTHRPVPAPASARIPEPPPPRAREAAGSEPRIREVRFRPAVATAGQDLRLQVEAWDPEGDPVTLQTEWIVDGRRIETSEAVLAHAEFARGSAIRARVRVRAGDGERKSALFSTDEIAVSNAPPVFTTFPGGFDATGTLVYPLSASDPDGDAELRFRLLEGPRGMRLEADGVLRWQPGPDQGGRHPVRLEVRDGHGGSDVQSFDLHVRRGRTPRPRAAEPEPRDGEPGPR